MRTILNVAAALCCMVAFSSGLSAQTTKPVRTAGEYSTRYNLLVGRVGASGLGIETLVRNWENDYPEDKSMLVAKYAFYYDRCQRTEVVRKEQDKFMGGAPVISLPDTLTGKKANFFQETFYDDADFAEATKAIDKAIKLYPLDIQLRFTKAAALVSYEKESPDMAGAFLLSIIDYDYSSKPDWLYGEEQLPRDELLGLFQEYCFVFYRIGSEVSMETFRSLSEKLSSYYPGNSEFLSNLGTYYFVWKKDNKNALKYYNKAIKVNPGEYSAIKNCVLLARKSRNTKLEKKYLPMLVKVTPDETERMSAQARLDALK